MEPYETPPRDKVVVGHKQGGVLWTEYAKNVADSLRCRPRSNERSLAKGGVPPTKRARRMSGRRTKPGLPAAKAGRSVVEVAVV
jgi:hypothetical protein